MAPEIIRDEYYDGKSIDAWSSGVVLYAMLYGSHPFLARNDRKMYDKILTGNFKFP